MGTIKTEVLNDHLSTFKDELDLLRPFLPGFNVTWARRRRDYNTNLSVYFLSPEQEYKDAFGFENEILLVYSPYKTMEPRVLQAVEQVFSTSPAKGRVETLNYFLISDSNDVSSWLESYISSRQETRIIISFSKAEVIANKDDKWFLRNKIEQEFFGRDLFNYTLPLVEDTYFFGRQNILMEYFDAVKRSENKALFGLRKTGKTSLLFKLQRLCETEKVAKVIYFDCKVPHIRKLRWFELIEEISSEIVSWLKVKGEFEFSEKKASKSFFELIKNVNEQNKKLCLIFDEIEYVSYISPKDAHWKEDYLEFWQTIWSCQSQFKCLSFVLAGVNPSVVETDLVNKVQNPLFGIVPHKYLTGFTIEEIKLMLKKLGRRMGMSFTKETGDEMKRWYGGHPLLIRMACSSLNSFMAFENTKPFDITIEKFKEFQPRVDQELTFYSNHAISEIREFYPGEYKLFELLATHQQIDFKERSSDQNNIKHLCEYQLIKQVGLHYEVNIPVIAKRVAMDSQKESGRELVYPIIDKEQRTAWLSKRIDAISMEFSVLEKLIKKASKPKLFGANSFPEGLSFSAQKVVDDVDDFSVFINTLNRCFVESIEKYGQDTGKPKYFWQDIKNNYPNLWSILHKIKVYRNERDHLHLVTAVGELYLGFINDDFEGKSFSQISEPYFVLQQRVLDGLLLSLLLEIDLLT